MVKAMESHDSLRHVAAPHWSELHKNSAVTGHLQYSERSRRNDNQPPATHSAALTGTEVTDAFLRRLNRWRSVGNDPIFPRAP